MSKYLLVICLWDSVMLINQNIYLLMAMVVFPYGGAPVHQQHYSGNQGFHFILVVFICFHLYAFEKVSWVYVFIWYCQKLIVICLTGGDEHDPSKTAVKASSAAILARILVMNTNYLAQVTSEPSLSALLQKTGFPLEENVLLCLVDIWLDKVSYSTT